MPEILVTGGYLISYDILKDYHATAQGMHEILKEKGASQEMDYEFQVRITAENEDEAEAIFLKHCESLNELGVAEHLGHLAYITTNLLAFEGRFMEDDYPLYQITRSNLTLLIKLCKLYKRSNKITIEITDSLRGKEFDDYIKLRDTDLISSALKATINTLFASIKRDEHALPHDLIEEIKSLNAPDLEVLQSIYNKLVNITEKAFNSQMLFTICKTLRDYLNTCSPLTHISAALTNDQARVIYMTCKLHGLINHPHEMDLEKVNYIRSVIMNTTHPMSLKGTTK